MAQIETKANAKISSSLGQKLGMNIPVADQEGKTTKYWEGVRDMAKLGSKQWQTLQDAQKFVIFLKNTTSSLSRRIAPEEKAISPLEELLQGKRDQPSSPLEEPPAPHIFYSPYPKGPPVASAEAIPKKIEEICPKCGEINEKREKGCKKCGASLIPFS